MDGVVPALGRADRVRRTRVVLVDDQRVVRALAVHPADRVDRGEVDDVEAHLGDRRQPLGRGGERAAVPQPGRLVEPQPSDRGKNSYQAPYSARSRSTSHG